ncbi:potassium-transporting ATPase subunit C [Serratia rubidaea]
MPPAQVARLIAEYSERPVPGFLGTTTVNVLQLNQALDALQ